MRSIDSDKIEFISLVLRVIGHPVRIKIIEALENNSRLSVNEISKHIGTDTEQSLLSHHLIKMKDTGLIDCQREGKNIFYNLKLKELSNLLDCMEKCCVVK